MAEEREAIGDDRDAKGRRDARCPRACAPPAAGPRRRERDQPCGARLRSEPREQPDADTDEDVDYDRYIRGVALLMRGLSRAELGDPAAGAVDIAAAVELAPDEETAADWREYLDDVREKSR